MGNFEESFQVGTFNKLSEREKLLIGKLNYV